MLLVLWLLCTPAVVASVAASPAEGEPTLIDHAIAAGSSAVYLDGSEWTVASSKSGATMAATVPGDIITDLQRAGKVADPYWNITWRDPSFIAAWNDGVWTYKREFATPKSVSGPEARLLLVFDGIRMGAKVLLNDKPLGVASNQFQRYIYEVNASDLHDGTQSNVLTVSFGAELGIKCGGRYTYSSQIDWAPDMLTKDPTLPARSTFGFGIWKSVYLVPLQAGEAAITQLVPHTFYAGGHPTSILSDKRHKGFSITLELELYSVSGGSGTVSALGNWPQAQAAAQKVTLVRGINTVTLSISAEQTVGVRLWHPHGHGEQPRYSISGTFTPSSISAKPAVASRLLGFRHIALVTVNDTDPAVVSAAAKGDGTGQLTMFFRVNGAPVYARGGNKIPMDLLEGRMSAVGHRRLIQSAVEGNFNMLRVWGGGIWEPRAFFDAADEFGVLLYTDMQFTWGDVTGSKDELAELQYQLKRLSHHPSIALWDACNECGGGGLYQSFVMPNVAAMDKSRPIWPSCPAPGWVSGVDSLGSYPNGHTLVTGAGKASGDRPLGVPFGQETHGPYTAFMKFGMDDVVMPGAFPEDRHAAVPGGGGANHPTAVPARTGPGEEGWYKSEFGCTSWSSFESMAATMPSDQWSMSSAAGQHRNWNVSNVIFTFFGEDGSLGMKDSGEVAFKRQLYQSMIGQQLFLKTEMEAWRSQNVWGTTFWMYNEIWPTSGWGSIEYGPPGVPGQVEGGRWKPLHYTLRSSTFADQLSTCNTAGACFVTNDAPFSFKGSVSIRLLNMLSGSSAFIKPSVSLDLPAGPRVVEWFCAEKTSNLTKVTMPEGFCSPTFTKKYNRTGCQIPNPRGAYTKTVAGTESDCEAACDIDEACIGFTMTAAACYLYNSAPELQSFGGADWYQKPGTTPIPGPPPTPSPPPQLSCPAWTETAAWKEVKCDVNGTDCVLLIEVANSTGTQVSYNVLPFAPPKKMQLPTAVVTASVGTAVGEKVSISLSTTATAMYVVMTTKADGRFSDNSFVLEAGKPHVVSFISWGALDAKKVTLLKSSLRIEHLAENIGAGIAKRTWQGVWI